MASAKLRIVKSGPHMLGPSEDTGGRRRMLLITQGLDPIVEMN
jgi:hypothetical protein